MGEKRIKGFVLRAHKGDHPPLHVHILRNGRELGRWDVEHQRPMGDLVVTTRLTEALIAAGYAKKGSQ